jgi:hypothetical protein
MSTQSATQREGVFRVLLSDIALGVLVMLLMGNITDYALRDL